jgi:ElaB/YqjD/DUF883 family membrane-anchored ribosome-binding protein
MSSPREDYRRDELHPFPGDERKDEEQARHRYRDDYRSDTEKEPRDLEREIDATRAHMEHTLDLLERKLSPGEIIDELLTMARRNGGGFARNLTTQIQNNPVPTLLTGVGLAWLMSASDRPPEPRGGYRAQGAQARSSMAHAGERAGQMADSARSGVDHARESAHEYGRKAREMGHEAGERARDLGEHIGNVAHRAREYMHEMTDSLGANASDAGRRAQRARRWAGDEYQHLLHEQPLLLAGVGLAIGAALGALMPRTQTEDELMGEYSDRVKREAKQEGQRQYQRARDTAEEVAGAAGHAASEKMSDDTEKQKRDQNSPQYR